jgi:hypothetical protein
MRRFLAHLSTGVREGESVAVVGHGSFLGSLWPALTGRERADRLNNLDGILLDATIGSNGEIQVHSHHEISCPYNVKPEIDRCDPGDQQKIAVLRKRMSRSNSRKSRKTVRKTKRSRRSQQQQQGGGVNMPLAYFQDGAQMRGTEGSETGVGLAGMSSGFVREALTQTGGKRRTLRGGFSPSVMGAFAANGARLLPLAAYMGYKMYSNDSGSSSSSSHHRRTKKSKRSKKNNRS